MDTLQLIMFSANFAFIITNLYGWLLKRYYVPEPFRGQFDELYPAHRLVATLYLLQLFEIPYLFNIGEPAALFYVNGTAVMFFSSYTYVLVKGYFFLDEFSPKRMLVFMLPVVICWLALLLPVVGLIEFSDTFKVVTNVWFVFYTLNPHRTVRPEVAKAVDDEMVAEDENKQPKWHLSEKKCKEIEDKMMDLLQNDKLYLSDHFTMSELAHKMGVNRSYVGEVISRGSYESFYRLINTFRVEYACALLNADSHGKMEQVAMESGFSSGSAFSQVFKKIKGVTPREYIENKNSISE